MKRHLAAVSVLALLALSFGSCAPAGPAVSNSTPVAPESAEATAAPPSPAQVTITFWHSYGKEVEDEMLRKKVIPAFEQAHSNIKVEALKVPNEDLRRKLLTAMAGGTAPDLVRTDILWLPEFADLGALAPLDDLMSDFATLKDKVFEGPLETNLYKGHYYGLPLDTNTRVMVYNVGLLQAAGIEAPPKTMDELVSDCEKIKALGQDKYCFAEGGTYAWAVNPWIWSFGGDVTDPEVTKATGYLNGPATVEAYEFMNEMVQKGYWHPGILGGGIDTWGGLAQDQIAMVLEGPWMPPAFETQFPGKKIGLAPMPAGKGGSVSVVGGEDIVMFQQSKNKEAAAEFIRFMLSPEAQLAMGEAGQIPVLKELVDSDFMRNHPYFGAFAEQLKSAKARTPHPAWPRMEEALTEAGQYILLGQQGPQQALDAAAAKIDGLLGAQ